MNKLLLSLSFLAAAVLVLCFFTYPDFNNFIINQLAAVIGIDIKEVKQWQAESGFNRKLALGDSGSDVRLLQSGLYKIVPDFSSDSVTGYFGSKTSEAVSNFQTTQGLEANGSLDKDTREALNNVFLKELCPDGEGNEENIFPDEIMIYVNKEKSLPENYIPKNLIDISKKVRTAGVTCIKEEVLPYLQKMFEDAKEDNIFLIVSSGFRRPEIQSILFKVLFQKRGERAKEAIAEPFHSEHQLGTAMDLSGRSINYIGADDTFNGTVEDLWLRQNAYKYGFAQSYPKNKTEITGYKYEPWHYRFLGEQVAKAIFDRGISVEEYFSLPATSTTNEAL